MENSKAEDDTCIKCQWCCTHIYIPVLCHDPETLHLMLTRGIELRSFNQVTYAIMEQRCDHLTERGCDVYHLRPRACREYDGRMDMFHPEMCQLPKEG